MAAKISVGQQVISRNLSFFWLIYIPIHLQFVWRRLSLDADFLPWLARIGALSGRFYCYHHSYSRSDWKFGKTQRLSASDCLGIPRQDDKDHMGTIVSVFGIEIDQPFYGSDSSWRTTKSKGCYRRGAFQISIDSHEAQSLSGFLFSSCLSRLLSLAIYAQALELSCLLSYGELSFHQMQKSIRSPLGFRMVEQTTSCLQRYSAFWHSREKIHLYTDASLLGLAGFY